MVKAEDIKLAISCLFPDTNPLWMMLHTCERFGVQPFCYGLGDTYAGWLDIKVKRLAKVARELRDCGFTHIMYSDGRDAWLCAGMDEVAEKYNALGAPPLLLSAQRRPFCGGYAEYYAQVDWDTSKAFPYVGTPGQLCSCEALASALDYMAENYKGCPDDDPAVWCSYMAEFPVRLDHDCSIFMNVGDMDEGEWEVRDGRAYNRLTETEPCVIHFNGGGSDALKGKWESLEKWWKAFGYTKRPPWEG